MHAHDHITLLTRANEQMQTVISRVRPEQATVRTPCHEWDVRALVNHVLRDVELFTVTSGGGTWEEREGDRIGDDWVGACRESNRSID